MLEFEKITMAYSEDEDRISISAVLRDGGTARIWLTQRMANRLIPALINAIKPRHKDPAYVDIIAGVSLTKAIARQEPQAPVSAKEPGHEWLVSKIDLQMPTSGAVVIFYGTAGQSARIGFNFDLLRQWLSILQRVYAAAEWRGADWPDWMAAPSEKKAADRLLH
jgi:hypothetical protein